MSKGTGYTGTLPHIDIQPTAALIDAPVSIQLRGFAAGQQVTVYARMANYLSCTWESQATFLADAQGCVNVSTQRPAHGTYEQPDPMGLFWSMAPPAGAEFQGISVASVAPLRVRFEAEVEGVVVASAQAERKFKASEVTCTEIHDHGMVATLFRPSGSGVHPAILVLGGSGGGLWEAPAALLASHGFVALALAYFGIAPLSPGLVEIPLEYFGTAIRWLQQQDGVRPQSLAVLGQTRGGELALLLGATFPELRAVVAYVPSGVLWMGTPVAGAEPPSLPPAWTRNGQPLPFMRSGFIASAIDWQHPPVATSPGFTAALQDEEAVAQATIPVEHTRGAILMLSGQDDQMWPSPSLAEIAVRRLQQRNFAFPVEHVSYPHAGHLFPLPYLPTTITHSRHPILKVDFAYGGTPAGNAFAGADSWSKVVAFLRKNLE